jgi:hypothetical protein
MAIENGRLVVGPTLKRDQEKLFFVSYTTNTEPGVVRYYTDEDGNISFDAQLPEVEGQIVVFQEAQGDEVGTAYVAVTIDNVLYWKPVIRTLDLRDSRTTNSWDPLAGFYDPLAS